MIASLPVMPIPAVSGAIGKMIPSLPSVPSPVSTSKQTMPVGIIDYGVPIVDEPMDTDAYVTLPGIRKDMIFDPGEGRVFRDPLKSNAERFRDPRVSWQPDTMSLNSEPFTQEEFDRKHLDGKRIAEMTLFLRDELDYSMKPWENNPLRGSKELTLLVMKKYVEIFEFFPDISHLLNQGLLSLWDGIFWNGGGSKIMEEIGAKSPTPAAREKPVQEKANAFPRGPYQDATPKTITTPSRESDAPRVDNKKITERGDNFVAIDNGYHPPADVEFVMRFMTARIENAEGEGRMRRDFEGDSSLYSVALAKGRRWIPVQADSRRKKLFFRKKEIPALIFVAKGEFGSDEVFEDALRELRSQSRALNEQSPPWLQLKIWAARELSIDLDRLGRSLRSVLNQRHVQYFFAKTLDLYGDVETSSPRTRKSSSLTFES